MIQQIKYNNVCKKKFEHKKSRKHAKTFTLSLNERTMFFFFHFFFCGTCPDS